MHSFSARSSLSSFSSFVQDDTVYIERSVSVLCPRSTSGEEMIF